MAGKSNSGGSGEKQSASTPADLARTLSELVAAIFGGAAGALTLGPPTDVPALTTALTIAVAAIAWLLAWVLGSRLGLRISEKRYRTRCLVVLLIAVVGALGAVVWYVVVRDELTARCGDERYVVGTELTEQGKKVAEARGYRVAEDLLMAAGCNSKEVWTAESLRRSAMTLWGSFFLVIGSLVFPLIFLSHVLASDRGRGAA